MCPRIPWRLAIDRHLDEGRGEQVIDTAADVAIAGIVVGNRGIPGTHRAKLRLLPGEIHGDVVLAEVLADSAPRILRPADLLVPGPQFEFLLVVSDQMQHRATRHQGLDFLRVACDLRQVPELPDFRRIDQHRLRESRSAGDGHRHRQQTTRQMLERWPCTRGAGRWAGRAHFGTASLRKQELR